MKSYIINPILSKTISKTFFPLLILLFCLNANAQENKIGKVADSSGHAISNVIIVLESAKDSSLINTIFPDASGVYSLPSDASFPMLMHVSSLGYKEQYILLSDAAEAVTALNVILVQNENRLNEVVIQSAKPLIERKIDRTVFNVGSSIVASGGDAMDAIKKSPGVMVKNEEISLVGKSDVKVMVNDKLLQLAGDDLASYLRTIPASNIDRIEVITAPPAKYSAEGNSGLINIILKKNQANGFNGNARVILLKSKGEWAYGNLSLNYRKDKFNVYVNGGHRDGYGRPTEENTTQFPTQIFNTKDERKDGRNFNNINAGIDYNIQKDAILGIQFNYLNVLPNISEVVRSNIYGINKQLDSISQTNAFNRRKFNVSTLNLNYDWKIDSSGKKISVNINRFWNYNNQQRDYHTQGLYADNSPTGNSIANRTLGQQNIIITTGQIDVEHPTKWLSLSYGGKLSFTKNTSNNVFESVQGKSYEIDPTKSNEFIYNENVQALYVNTQKEMGKWSFQLGLRGEFTQTTGNSATLAQVNTNKYFKLFPTAYVMYTFNEDNILNLNYSKRINRPYYQYLDPFRWYVTPFDYAVGNPFLQPSFNNNFELSYRFKKNYSIALTYQHENKIIDQPIFRDTVHNTVYTIRDNIGTSDNIGLDFNLNLAPTKWWQTQLELTGFHYSFSSDYFSQGNGLATYKCFGGYIESKNSFTLNNRKTLLAECNGSLSTATQSGFYQNKPYGGIDLGLKVLMMQKNLTLNITVSDILATERSRGYSTVNLFRWNNYYDNRYIRLAIAYKFGNQHVKAKRERATGIEAESGRAGQ